MVYHNALFSIIIFNKEGASQTFLSKTIDVSQYIFLYERCSKKDACGPTRENIWGGLPHKWSCDLLNEKE